MKKAKRVLKYFVVLVMFVIFSAVWDAAITYYFPNVWEIFLLKKQYLVLYGAMAYRLISTWEHEPKTI